MAAVAQSAAQELEENPVAVVGGAAAAAAAASQGGSALLGALTLVGGAVAEVLPPLFLIGAVVFVGYEIYEYYETPPATASEVSLSGSYKYVGPADPNSLYGPGGYGPQGFVAGDVPLPYFITFANDATADAPAQVVTVTQQLSTNLDWSTFQLGDFGFGGVIYPVPAGLTSYSTVIDDTASEGVFVDVDASFNALTGLLTWTFTSIDPTTFGVPVGNPEEGLLPPDITPPEGDGFVSYSVDPASGDTTGTVINAQGTVIFQAGLPDQSSLNTLDIFNTIDDGPPSSSVAALPPEETSTSFTVTWSGQGDPGGSGIASYDIYVSDDGGPYALWESDTNATSATFTGQLGSIYSFYSVATDNVGNVQPTPTSAQETTLVALPLAISSVAAVTPATRNTRVTSVSVTLSEPAGADGFTASAVTLTDNGGPNLITGAVTVSLVSGSTYLIGGLNGLTTAEGNYTLTVNAAAILDGYGEAGAGSASVSWLMDTTPPTSTVNSLPSTTTSTSFSVSDTGTDPAGSNGSTASGVASFAIYVSTNGDPFTQLATVTPAEPSTLFTGQTGNTYGFYSIATDNAGNVQPTPSSVQQTVQILSALSVSSITPVSPNPRNSYVSSIDVTFNEPINTSGLVAGALTLTDDGGANLINSGVSLSLVSGDTYAIGGLTTLTNTQGEYTLTVNAADVRDQNGIAGANSLSTSWLMDATAPSSHVVNSLGTRQTSDTFPVSVAFSDPAGPESAPASGVSAVELWVSINNGAFFLYQTMNTTPAASSTVTFTFVGQDRNTYAFHSIAIDAAGNTESKNTNVIEASTSVPDLHPPVTHVLTSSSFNSTNGLFTLDWSGIDPDQNSGTPAGSIAVVDVYVEIDGGLPTLIGQENGGTPIGGVYSGSLTYSALADNAPHAYGFFSIGIDDEQKTQVMPATPDVTFSNVSYSAPLGVDYLMVEKGIAERSFIQYLDVDFNQTAASSPAIQSLSTALKTPGIADDSYVELLWYGEAAPSAGSPRGSVNLFGSGTTATMTLTGNDLAINFGANGITSLLNETGVTATGKPTTNFGDGWYALGIDTTGGNGPVFWEPFFRLFGSATGDTTVSGPYTTPGTDAYVVYNAEGETGTLLNADVDGSGAVNSKDLTYTAGARGDTVGAGLQGSYPSFQLFAGPSAALPVNAALVTQSEVQALLPAAIDAWQAAGLDLADLRKLQSTPIEVANLGTTILGLEADNLITINQTAAGYNWYVNAGGGSPQAFGVVGPDGQALAGPGSPAASEVDLLTVVEHGLGHVLGLPDNDQAGDLMDITLGQGVRRVPSYADLAAIGSASDTHDVVNLGAPVVTQQPRSYASAGPMTPATVDAALASMLTPPGGNGHDKALAAINNSPPRSVEQISNQNTKHRRQLHMSAPLFGFRRSRRRRDSARD